MKYLSPYLYMLGASFCFSIMSICGSLIGDSLSWIAISFFRILPTFIFILIFALLIGEKPILIGSFSLWLRSIFGTVALLCTFYSLSHLHATDTVTIFATTPIWIGFIMAIVFKDKAPPLLWVFVISTFIGICIIERPQFQGNVIPIFIAFIGAICAGSAMVSLSFCGKITPITVVSHYSMVAVITSFILFCFYCSQFSNIIVIMKKYYLLLIVIGVSGTVGQIFLTNAYGNGKPQWISILGLSQVLITMMIELFLNRMKVDIYHLIGMIMVLFSISCVIWIKPLNKNISKPI
ncbi:MAG TPA: DMT family transporter [Candidatus Hydrogenedens sp.]|nr:DMT family transporter [Candidatus Hydrogenedens sp.]HOL18906.1 DMT family transporter [Candidatus Hydrogenedens sp.]HPP57594.1 DMT family transporter [Candidatus Hydrogenedens sp.]